MAKLQNVRGTYDLYGEAKRKMKKVTSVGSEVVEKYGLKKSKPRFSSLPRFFPVIWAKLRTL